jgi:hypothetical protein
MQRRHRHKLLTAMLASLLLWSTVAAARIQILANNTAPPEISIRIGSPNNLDTVSFSVPTTQLGNSTSVEGTPRRIRIEVEIRSTAANPLTGSLTVDSLIEPLKNTNSSSNIPFTEISWESNNSHIPSGVFQEEVNQFIVSYQSSRRIRARHTFSYANTSVIEAGTYKGSVRYTWAVP